MLPASPTVFPGCAPSLSALRLAGKNRQSPSYKHQCREISGELPASYHVSGHHTTILMLLSASFVDLDGCGRPSPPETLLLSSPTHGICTSSLSRSEGPLRRLCPRCYQVCIRTAPDPRQIPTAPRTGLARPQLTQPMTEAEPTWSGSTYI